MGSRIRRLAKRDIVAKYLLFLAGVQIAAAVNLFTSVCFVAPPLRVFLRILVAGFSFGVSSFLSFMLSAEVEHVVKAGEAVLGTNLEKDRDDEMNSRLDEAVWMVFLGPRRRIDRIGIFFWSDIVLTALGIGMTIMCRP